MMVMIGVTTAKMDPFFLIGILTSGGILVDFYF